MTLLHTARKAFMPTLALAMLLGSVSAPALANEAAGTRGGIVGSWDASIDFFGAVSRAMYSFNRDGTLVEADNPGFDPNFNGDALSPGVGAWARTGRFAGTGRYQKFAYDTSGQLTLVYTSTIVLSLSEEGELEGTVSIEVATPDGVVVNEIPELAFTAARITAD